jgi:hypothetical protein
MELPARTLCGVRGLAAAAVLAALFAPRPTGALSVAPKPGPQECHAELPIPRDARERNAAEKVLLKVLPDFNEGRFSDFDVVNKVQKQTRSTAPGGCQEDAYGELPIHMARELFKHVALKQNDTFADLGSGLGKLPTAAVVLGGAKRALGVELSKERHRKACIGLQNISTALRKEFAAGSGSDVRATGQVTLRQGDFLKEDFHQTTVIYAASICFRDALMNQMGKKLGSEMVAGSRVAVSHNFPRKPPHFAWQGKKKAGVVDVFCYKTLGGVPQPKK